MPKPNKQTGKQVSGKNGGWDWNILDQAIKEREKEQERQKQKEESSAVTAPGNARAGRWDWSDFPTTAEEASAFVDSAAERQARKERQRQEEAEKRRASQLAEYGLQPAQGIELPGQTKALLDPLEQFKNGKAYQPRSFMDRDSVLQGKALQGAAQGANWAAYEGNETEYARHLKAYQKAAGRLQESAEYEDYKYLKEHPDVAYARRLSADEISGKLQETARERAAMEARRKEIGDERQKMRLRGEVFSVDGHGVAHYGPKDTALEQEDREAYARLQELEKELETLNSAKGLRTTFDAEKRVNAYESQARSNADFEALSSGRPESLNAFIGRNNGKNPENSWAQMVTQKYYGMTPDQKSVFHYLWAKDDEAGHAINGNEREAVQYMNAIPGLHDYYQKRQAEDAYVPQSYDNPLEKIAKVGRYLIDSLATGTDRAINADMVAKGVKAKNQDLLALAGQYAPEGFGGTMFRAAGSAAQSTGQMIPAMMAGNLAAAYVSAFPAAVASAGKATHDIVTAERLVKSAQNAVFFYTSKGQAMADAKEKGLTDAQAEIYSLLSAASEVWLQNAIGGVAQFGGIGERDIMLKINKINNAYLRTAAYHGLNVAGEVIEEEAQNFLEPLFVTMLTGQEYEMPSLQELLETFLSTAMMVSTTNVGANKEFYNSSKIRSNLQTMAELCRQEGGEYDQVAKSIDQYIQEVDAEPDGRFTEEGFYQACNLMMLAEENMKAHGVTAEDVRSGMAEMKDDAAAERDGETVPYGEDTDSSPAAQNDTMESGRPMTAPTEDGGRQSAVPTGAGNGGQRHEVRARAAEDAVQAAREKGYTIAVQEAQGMNDQEIQTFIRANEENTVGARQEGDQETAAMFEGIVQGLREVFDQRLAESDGLEFTGELRRSYDAEKGGQAMLVPTTENGGRPMTAPTNGGLNDGTAGDQGIADGGQRDGGLGAGEQAGGLGAGAEGSVAGGESGTRINDLKNYVKALGAEKQSSREIGIIGGTKNASVIPVDVEALSGKLHDSLAGLQEKAARDGVRLDFVLGKMEVRQNGATTKSSGVFQVDRDGTPHIFIQADSLQRSPEQLYEHEMFHAIVARNKSLWQDIVNDLYENHTEEEIRTMVEAYVSAYQGCYGTEDADVDKYLEELFADVYAGMQRGDSRARKARELAAPTAQRFAGDIENARQNRAGIERRNGPGVRLASTTADDANSYDGKDLSADQSVYTYDFLNKQDPMQIVEMPEVSDVLDQNGTIDNRRVIKNGLRDAAAVGSISDGKIFVKNKYTNKELRVDAESIRHGLNGDLRRHMTNARIGSVIGEVVQNSIPLNALYNTAKDVTGTYAMGCYVTDSQGREYVAIVTVEERTSSVVGLYAESSVHSVSGRQKKAAGRTQSPQGVYPSSTAKISIADFLSIVNSTHQSLLSSDVLSNFNVKKNPAGYYASRAKFSLADEDAIDWIGNRGQKFSPAEDDGEIDWIGKAQEDEETDSSPLAQNDEGGGRPVTAPTETRDGGRPMTAPTEAEGLAKEKKAEIAERASIEGLKSRIETEKRNLSKWKSLESAGLVTEAAKKQELKKRIDDVQETLDIFEAELKQKKAAKKAEKADEAKRAEKKAQRKAEKLAAQKEAELADNQPRQARKEFRQDALNLFSVQAGKRQALGNILNSFADKLLAKGSVSAEDRAELFRQLYEAGVEVVQAEDYYKNIRETVDNARIYVPESVRAEFGDDWMAFRDAAWGNGVYLTNSQSDRGADSWNAELAELFPGAFDAAETDAKTMLENIVDLAREGKAEFVSLGEMMRRNQAETGVTVDEQMDELERKMDQLIDTFAQKAELEVKTRKQGMMKLVKERQKNREMAARQVQRKRENDTRNQVMKQLQQLNKMRKRSAPEIQRQIDEIIGNLDTMARSISPEGLENLQALARKYSEAAEDPNFLGNPYVEARLARLSQVQLDDLEISDVIELGRTISALVKTVTEDKRLLTDERNREISEAAKDANREIASSAGSKGGKLREFFGSEHLSPTREIQRLGGWVRGGEMEQLSRALEDGGTRRMEYQRQATRIFDKFLSDKSNQKWLQKAQGKDADWISVTVPAGITAEDGSLKIQNVTLELTPMMRVGLLMHSRNVDNLRHIETGGIVIPNKEYYRKGDLANADAKGTRVKLRPEVVRGIVKDCTPQERAFAALLEQYYDGLSKDKINEVSMLIDGFERAGGDHYYGIKVSRKFLASAPEQVKRDMSLESIGSIVNERVHAGNPIILEDASTALKDHIDLISKYYGYTAAIRDFNAVMNYTFHQGAEEGGAVNAYAGSVKETLQDKWGAGAQKYMDELLADLQQSNGINETAAQFLAKLRGNLAGASLMFNPAVALSQLASIPGAAQTLGFDAITAGIGGKVDMSLIEKYSPVLWYRNQGNSTQELGDYMSRQGLEGKLPLFFNWIQKMDSMAIRRLWAAAEYRVSKDTDLSPGSKEEIDAGTDPYYQEVARVFQRAVYDTQPNYSEMQRPAILRSKSDLTKMLTMYKTVPLQYYNMMYEAAGRLKADKARYEQNGTAENKANYAKSRSFAAKTFAGVLGANVVYVVMKAAIKALLGGKDKKYKDEEGDWDAGKIFGSLGKDLVETYAGSVIFGSELLESMEKLYNAATTGSYSRYGGLEISALGAVEDTLGGLYNLAKEIHDQDLTGGLGAIKDLAKQFAMDFGIPANNIETYLLGTMKWMAPEWVDRYENFFDEFERSDLKGEHGRELWAAIRVLMDNRTDGLKDETVDELTKLWASGQNAAIPSAIPSKVSVDGEDVEIKGSDRSAFRERWGQVVSGSLEQLLASDAYQAEDDKGKAALIGKLYDYARQQAMAAVTGKEPSAWAAFGQACEAAGIPLVQYLAVASVDKSDLKEMDGTELESAIESRMGFRVGELGDKTLEELSRLYAGGGTGAIPSDVPTGISVGGEEHKLTPDERVSWLQSWQRTVSEGLEDLMSAAPYKAADDAGKVKMITALYDIARAGASAEVVDGYAPDKWISVGMEAEDRGVPIDEYAAFHVGLSGLKTAEKLDLLKKQSWSNDQKEYLWKELMASDTQAAKYENLKNAGVAWADAMDRLGIGAATATSGLTDEQQAQYDKYWNDISGPATQRLLNNTAYKQADKAAQAAYLDRLNDFAARSAKAKVLSGYDKGKWVECGERLTAAGVALDDYIVYCENTSDANNRAKYEALAKTKWTDAQKLIALEYVSASTCSAAKVGKNYEVPLDLYLEGLTKADADQSGNINQEEAAAWIDQQKMDWDLKAYLWQMLCASSKWKNNPYSATFGEEIWHSLHPDN